MLAAHIFVFEAEVVGIEASEGVHAFVELYFAASLHQVADRRTLRTSDFGRNTAQTGGIEVVVAVVGALHGADYLHARGVVRLQVGLEHVFDEGDCR